MDKKGTFFIILAAVFWGIAGLFVKQLAHYGVSDSGIVFYRSFTTAIIIGLIAFVRDRSAFRIKLKDLWLFALNGFFSIVMFNFCYYKTMHLSSLSVAAVLLYTAPIFVMIISVFLFGEKLTVKKVLALILAFFGCVLVSGALDSVIKLSPAALIYGLFTGLGYALYTIFSNLLMKRGYGTLTIIFYTFVFSSLGSSVLTAATDAGDLLPRIPGVYLWAALMGFFNTVLPYIFYTVGLRRMEASKAPVIATVEPVAATLLGLCYGEKPTVFGVLGIIAVLSSVVIINLGKVKKV
ncbi:MAG: EamA family transporter [Clostridia bacterium]|nr:EamA family transporter [Clostridia bacterium]